MSKGSKRRLAQVGSDEFNENWAEAFHRNARNRQSMKNRSKPKEVDGEDKKNR